MTSPFASRDAQIEQSLALSSLRPSALLGRPLVLAEADVANALGPDLMLTRLQTAESGADLLILFSANQNGAFAVKIDVMQIRGRHRVAEVFAQQFGGISGPLDQLKPVPLSGADLAGQLSPLDNFTVASRGDILISVSTDQDVSANRIAQAMLDLIF